MKNKALITLLVVFFLIINTMSLWDNNLGFTATLVFLALFGIFIALGLSLFIELFKASKERFCDRARNLRIVIIGIVFTTTLVKPFGLIDYEKYEEPTILIAQADGVASCQTTLKLKADNTFKEKSVCFGIEQIKGKYRIENDTIFFEEVVFNRFTDRYYEYAIIKSEQLDKNKKYLELTYKDDTNRNRLEIVYNELDK